MFSKSKTKKVFTDQLSQKQNETNSLNSLMKRFKSHDIYSTTTSNKQQPPPRKSKPHNKINEGTTITINLNLPQTNVNINNWNQRSNNTKRVFSEKHFDSKKNFLNNDNQMKKESVSLNHYTNNTSRLRNQIDTLKILNEESILELDTEENFNGLDEKTHDSFFSGSINETPPSKGNKIKHIATIPLFQNKFLEEIKVEDKKSNNIYDESYDNSNRRLIIAAKKGDKESVLELIEILMNDNKGKGLNFKDENGWNAMHYACDEGNLKIVEILIKTHIDLNNTTNDKRSPLHIAARHGYFDISKLLIENGAFINCFDNEKNTPIHLCTMTNHIELLKYLCERSKNIEKKNIYGKTPYDLASKEETKMVLKQYINKTPNQEMINVKIHTINSKHANTLIKHINCQGNKTPIKFINYNSSTNNNMNTNTNKNINNLRPSTSKNKFNNHVQNNNININISTNLCNISHPHNKQSQKSDKINASVNTIKHNNNNTTISNFNENTQEMKWTTETNPLSKIRTDSGSQHNNKDIATLASVPKFVVNERSTSQNLNKSKKLFNHKASSMPHKEECNTKTNNKTKNTIKNKIEKSYYNNNNITSDKIKTLSKDNQSLSKDVFSRKKKDKDLSDNHIPNKRDSKVRVANVEIILEQGNTFQKEPDEIINEDKLNNDNQIISFINLSEVNLDEEEEQEQGFKHNYEQDQFEENNKKGVNQVSNINHSISKDDERIGPNSFICLALLGKGSFGEVYLVKKISTNLLYAMKVLNKDKIMGQNIVKYAMTERNVLSLTSHPFIVKLNYAFQTNEKLFLLLDYCPGGDLAEKLTKETRFSESQAKLYLCEIILALGNLHQKNIIFRDLKPDNIVLDSEGHAMLTDFGLSREGVFDSKIAKSFCGSIAYLAPEMLSRKGHGKAVDWYLLGVLFYEMLVGIPPYFTNSKEQIFKNIQNGKLEIPRWVSQKAAALVKLLLEKNPNERLGSKNDVEEIKLYEYFEDINWNAVYNRELKPPIPTNLSHALHTFKQPKLFSDKDDESINDIGIQQKFEGWSFIQNNNNTTTNNGGSDTNNKRMT